MFDSIPVQDARARRLAEAVRTLDLGYRAMRQQVHEEAGISSAELDALVAVSDAGQATPTQLAAATGLTASATTALIDRMERTGLLERNRHPTDRRSVVVVTTERGRELIAAAWRDYVGRFETLLSAHPCASGALDDLVVSLERLAAALPASRLTGCVAA